VQWLAELGRFVCFSDGKEHNRQLLKCISGTKEMKSKLEFCLQYIVL